MDKIYDIAILGGGPGGMTAAIYAKRAGLDVVIIEKNVPGGAVATTYEVANYPGFTTISGMDLATKMFEHTQSLNIEFAWDEVKKVKVEGDIKEVECYQSSYKAKTLILGFGASVRKLNLDNEKAFIGKGISYCATCDGNLFKGKTVAIVGGGNTALEDCFYLSNLAEKVYLIHRRDEFRGDQILSKQVIEKENIEIVYNSTVSKITGDTTLKSIDVLNKVTNETKTLTVDGLFVCIGRGPDTEMVDGDLTLNAQGYIVTDDCMRTNYEGVYAIGDIRQTPLRQIVTACSDGAIAATKAFEYIKTKKAQQK
ncbi:MAG: thioredoxin-disulfide reductase [Clostridia bacterium]|nr:thioredoxin-disulfide reductase [Clostridia bacterium]